MGVRRARAVVGGGWSFVVLVVVVGALAVGAGLWVSDARTGTPGGTADPAQAVATDVDPAHAAGDHAHGGATEIPPSVDPEDLPLRTDRQERAEFTLDGDVKVFTLTAEAVRWELLDDTWVTAWGYNGQVPGPEIWVDEGDRVRIELTNELPAPTTIHWHGIDVPNEMDGVPGVTQDPIEPGERYVYEFEAQPTGTFWYHSHFDDARQQDMGLGGAFIIRGQNDADFDRDYVTLIDEWIRLPDGRNGWEGAAHAGHSPAEYNWFTINGKAFPATEDMVVTEGDRVRIRMINAGYQAHPMHLHGRRFRVIAKDGALLDAPYLADTVLIGAGERYDVEFVAERPGDWMFHCHIPHHTQNDAVGPGGLISHVTYEGHRNRYQQERDHE
ncbi:MAG: copper oxidase [Egibacteraceae bacterium]